MFARRETLAKSGEARSEILSDDHAPVAMAFQRQHSQHLIEPVVDVGPLRGRRPGRRTEEPHQAHDVVDAQNAVHAACLRVAA